jgi:hypothetical protein
MKALVDDESVAVLFSRKRLDVLLMSMVVNAFVAKHGTHKLTRTPSSLSSVWCGQELERAANGHADTGSQKERLGVHGRYRHAGTCFDGGRGDGWYQRMVWGR